MLCYIVFYTQQMYGIRLNELLHISAFLYSIAGITVGNQTKSFFIHVMPVL
jgi:hypothetical protein